MKLSLRGEYALRALMVLGENYTTEVVRIQRIAERQAIPKRFLEQILNDLKAGGFVESKRGIAGGYRLARSPEQVSLAMVIRHIEGTLAPATGISDKTLQARTNADEAQHAIRSVMKDVRDAIVQVLERVTIADLCKRAQELRGQRSDVPDYTI
jgi:Rrf2 family transcriptional regulator, cysteine metabolism repressor